jgi:signal transduction histidine kinase
MLCVCTKPSTTPAPGQATGQADECPHPERWEDGRSHYDEWLATLVHELRSPLVTALSALGVMPSGPGLDRDTRRARDVAERQARRALQLVDDLFDVCAGSRGKLPLRKEAVDLAEVVAGATEAADHLLAGRAHRLTVSLPPRPVTLDGDRLRLEQVLTNLLANAAKYTDPGGDIRLTAAVEAGLIVLRVRDNGRGIAADLLPRVFDMFRQGPDSPDRAESGLGIGLALVKSLVELHGGSVAASSDGPGTGSEFVVRLPARDS